MNRLVLALCLVAVAAGSAAAQSRPGNPASTAGTAGVKQHLQALHYKDIHGLRRGPGGEWTGKATRNGIERDVTVSPRGSVTAR